LWGWGIRVGVERTDPIENQRTDIGEEEDLLPFILLFCEHSILLEPVHSFCWDGGTGDNSEVERRSRHAFVQADLNRVPDDVKICLHLNRGCAYKRGKEIDVCGEERLVFGRKRKYADLRRGSPQVI
jgi:hypothetical protein